MTSPSYLHNLMSVSFLLAALAFHLSSLLLVHRHHPRYEQLIVLFDTLYLVSGINSRFVSLKLIPVALFLTHRHIVTSSFSLDSPLSLSKTPPVVHCRLISAIE